MSAGFTTGDFQVNGQTVTVVGTDSVGDVFAKIANATQGAVTGRLDSAAGGGAYFRLDSKNPVTLGAGSCNFLSQARLNIWGVEGAKTDTVDSHYGVGIDDVNLRTPITPGTLTINGQKLTINQGDSLASVIRRLNLDVISQDGLYRTRTVASYDWKEDVVSLENQTYLMSGTRVAATPLVLGDPSDTSNFLEACRLRAVGTSAAESSESIAQFLRTPAAAAATLAKVKTALVGLTQDAAAAATAQSRLQVCMDQLGVTHESLTRASSLLQDVDMAEEATQFSRAQILVQSGTAMLAQANLSPQSVMKLLS